jgi:hypothetical protein
VSRLLDFPPEEAPSTLYDGTSGDPTVIAFDPGGSTGWSLFQVHPDSLIDPEVMILDNVLYFACGEFYGTEMSQVDAMLSLVDEWPGSALVTEDFILDTKVTSQEVLSPVRLNAAFKYTASRLLSRHVWVQNREQAFSTVTDDRLQKLHRYWNATVGQEHARDAVKHNLTFMRRLKQQPKLLARVFPVLAEA